MNRKVEAVRPRGPAPGFTLIEILIALAIMTIILSVVYGALSRTLTAKQIAEERAEMYAQGREAVLRIASELETALRPGIGDGVFLRGRRERDNPPRAWVQFVNTNRGRYGMQQVRSGRVIVTYFLEEIPGSHGLFTLWRSESLLACELAAVGRTAVSCDDMEEYERGVVLPLLDCLDTGEVRLPGSCIRVIGLGFRYYDDADGRWHDEWSSLEADTAMYNRLPRAIEITLLLEDERGLVHPFSTTVDLPLSRGQPTPGPDAFEEDDGSDEEGLDEDDEE